MGKVSMTRPTYKQVKTAARKVMAKGDRPTVKQVCKILGVTHSLDNAKVFDYIKQWQYEEKKKSKRLVSFKSASKDKAQVASAALLALKQKVKKRTEDLKQSL